MLKKYFLFLFTGLVGLTLLQAKAFIVYNNTQSPLFVIDTSFSLLNANFKKWIFPGKSESCNRHVYHCRGNVHLQVMTDPYNDYQSTVCDWSGTLKEENEDIFTIEYYKGVFDRTPLCNLKHTQN